MDTEGTYDARHTRSGQVPRPAGPPPRPSEPPRFPAGPPAPGGPAPESPFMAWLRAPRVLAGPGIWSFEHKPRPKEEPHRLPGTQLLAGAAVSFLCGWLLWSLLVNGYLGPYWRWPLLVFMPDEWRGALEEAVADYYYRLLFICVLAVVFGRLGRWPEVWRRYFAPTVKRLGRRMPKWMTPAEPENIPQKRLIQRAVLAFVGVWVVWLLCVNNVFGSVWQFPVELIPADSWEATTTFNFMHTYYVAFTCVLLAVFGRIGCWSEVRRRYSASSDGGKPHPAAKQETKAPVLQLDQAEWNELRAAGAATAADRLAYEARAGLMNDVDHARLTRAWQSVRVQPGRLPAFVESVQQHGSGACIHPSGARDLQARTARHDLLTGQVRIGTAAEDIRNPYDRRGAGCALEPAVLGTSLLAVGPPGAGKTTRLVQPLLESLCLQALAGRAAVVSVGAAGGGAVGDEAFDAVIRVGHRGSGGDLDLYGGTEDPDEAAGVLAEALVGDLAATLPGGDSRRAATALGQLLGPFRAAHGRFPAVAELRELLDGSREALAALRTALEAARASSALRELDARERQAQRAGDVGALLADRIALLDRPAFAGFFDPTGRTKQVSLRALDHPLRVRIDLPERGHADASRILARLVLAQFTECAVARSDRSVFACLVLDDASHVVTQEALRGLQRLRSANAGVVLTLRSLDDVPESLRGALLGTVGCRMAFAGVTTWDGARFAEVWGKAWVETRDVTDRQIVADEPFTKVMHSIRRLVTGKDVTAKAVTVRTVERERWSASDLANAVPAGHAVLSVTSVTGETAPPVLVDLRG